MNQESRKAGNFGERREGSRTKKGTGSNGINQSWPSPARPVKRVVSAGAAFLFSCFPYSLVRESFLCLAIIALGLYCALLFCAAVFVANVCSSLVTRHWSLFP